MNYTKDEKNKMIAEGCQLLRPRFNHKKGCWDIAKRTKHCGWTVIIEGFISQEFASNAIASIGLINDKVKEDF